MNDQQVVVIATIVQCALLAVNAGLFVWYLVETRRMRLAAQHQVEKSTALVRAAQLQGESEIRPAVVVTPFAPRITLHLLNVGKGPAVNLTLEVMDGTLSEPMWVGKGLHVPRITGSSLAQNSDVDTTLAVEPFVEGKTLQLRYESLSGAVYASLVEFSIEAVPVRTRFFAKA